ncbi:MAG: SDR family NAD(P)-dependent oxidoreductase [Loktanella sp.]|nr:SDR family NAD(P)-dependent oxidoreductase [Loktanella sp.]
MPHRLESLHGAVIVIVDASGDFGRRVAFMLAAEGAKVVVAAQRKPVLDELVAEIEAKGGSALAVQTNVSCPSEVARLAEHTVFKFGRIDVWINHVSAGDAGYFWDIPVEDHERMVDINLKGLICGAHTAIRVFRAQGCGTLINTSSISDEQPQALQTTYFAMKAAVLSLSHSLNDELQRAGDHGIRVGAIMPWSADTPWWYYEANAPGNHPLVATVDDPKIIAEAILNTCIGTEEAQPVGW